MDCPPFKLNRILGKKWTLPLVEMLAARGGMGFSSMEKQLGSITPKVLSQRLHQLQESGMASKNGDVYELTPQGERLYRVVRALKDWHDNEKGGCTDRLCVCCPLFKP